MWVELGQDAGHKTVSQRQVQRLAARAGLPGGKAAAAHLARLRTWAEEHAPDGSLTGVSPRTIARAAGWRGAPEMLLAALEAAGCLRRRPGGTRLCGVLLHASTEAASVRRRPLGTQPQQPVTAHEQPTVQPAQEQVPRGQQPPVPASGARLHVSGLWQAALRELAGMVNEANFEAFLRDTIGLYQSGGWITIGVPSAYVQEVLAQRFRTTIDRALYEVTGRPLHARLLLLPPLPPTSA